MRVLIIGCGYVGIPLGAEMVRQGHEVLGINRTREREEELKAAGMQPWQADITQPSDLERLPGPFDWIVNLVSSSRGGADVYRKVYREGTRHLIQWMSQWGGVLKRFLYTSSTSVYGQQDGSWVDESSPTDPGSDTGKILVETEKELLEAAREEVVPAMVLRVAGIYGPGRGHLFQQYLKNEAKIIGPGSRYLNMVQLEDLIGAILAALQRGKPGEVYNVADHEPVAEKAFFHWLSQALAKPMPPSVGPGQAAPRKRGLTDKRVSNRKLVAELGYSFRYPTFREGYQEEIRRQSLSG